MLYYSRDPPVFRSSVPGQPPVRARLRGKPTVQVGEIQVRARSGRPSKPHQRGCRTDLVRSNFKFIGQVSRRTEDCTSACGVLCTTRVLERGCARFASHHRRRSRAIRQGSRGARRRVQSSRAILAARDARDTIHHSVPGPRSCKVGCGASTQGPKCTTIRMRSDPHESARWSPRAGQSLPDHIRQSGQRPSAARTELDRLRGCRSTNTSME